MARHVFPTKKIKSKITLIVLLIVAVVITLSDAYEDYRSFEKAKQAISQTNGLFSAHFIDVGQGDSTLLATPDGKYMLIDCGPTDSSDYVVKYLDNIGVDKLEYLVISHPHEDHYGGAEAVLQNFEVENLIVHKEFVCEYPYDMLINEFGDNPDNEDLEVFFAEAGDSYDFSDCAEFMIIAPEKPDKQNLNNASICLKVIFGSTAFLFTGDAEKSVEKEMIGSSYNLSADVFKAAHHGSSTSNIKTFIEQINPKFAVVSCEKENDYGHPHKETLDTFKNYGVTVLRTDEISDIIISSDGEDVRYIENIFSTETKSQTEAKDNYFFEYIFNLIRKGFRQLVLD